VVLSSPHESLWPAALEAWRAGRPTLATDRSDVLTGQSARSGGGLRYVDGHSYARQVARLASDPELRALLGSRGERFAAAQTWDACARRWRALIARVRRPLDAGAGDERT
jgi:glycosyltransferase involved in cell wall biosynthesis